MTSLSSQAQTRTAAPPTRARAPHVKPLVLVVEDHEDTRFMLIYLLEVWGYRVSVAADGEAAVQAAEQEHPDLILMDTSLPRLDGLAATRRIRAAPALHAVPIIFLSGHAHPASRAAALATGGNDYLIKPFALSELEQLLDTHLGQH